MSANRKSHERGELNKVLKGLRRTAQGRSEPANLGDPPPIMFCLCSTGGEEAKNRSANPVAHGIQVVQCTNRSYNKLGEAMSLGTRFTAYCGSAWCISLIQIAVWCLVVACCDSWALGEISLAALLAYFGGCLQIMLRRPWTPSRMDLVIVRFGYIPTCLLSAAVFYSVWRARGLL